MVLKFNGASKAGDIVVELDMVVQFCLNDLGWVGYEILQYLKSLRRAADG